MRSENWTAIEDSFSIWVVDEFGNSVADVISPHDIPPSTERIELAMRAHRRRARLIAASPKLLEHLKGIALRNRDSVDLAEIIRLVNFIENGA